VSVRAYRSSRLETPIASRRRWISRRITRPDQSSPHHSITSPRSILILSTHLRLGLPSSFFTLAYPPITYTRSIFPIRATCPTHLILIDLIIVIYYYYYYCCCCYNYYYYYCCLLLLLLLLAATITTTTTAITTTTTTLTTTTTTAAAS
jgi:hypothetical protein